MEIKLIYNRMKWRVITLYNQNVKKTLEEMMKEIKEEEREYLMTGGDFNARIGNKEVPIGTGEKKEGVGRKSKDKTINKEGKEMLNKIGKRGWTILNGSYEERRWSYIGEVGTSVIDYVVANEKALEEVKKVEEGNRIESHHVPLEVEIKGKEDKKERKSDIKIKEKSI